MKRSLRLSLATQQIKLAWDMRSSLKTGHYGWKQYNKYINNPGRPQFSKTDQESRHSHKYQTLFSTSENILWLIGTIRLFKHSVRTPSVPTEDKKKDLRCCWVFEVHRSMKHSVNPRLHSFPAPPPPALSTSAHSAQSWFWHSGSCFTHDEEYFNWWEMVTSCFQGHAARKQWCEIELS